MDRDFYEKRAREKLVTGDIFDRDAFVIPVKTGGRVYGKISQQALARGIEIPDVALGSTKVVGRHVFLALWSDDNVYSDKFIADCGVAVINAASTAGFTEIAIPVLAGFEFLPALEKGVGEQLDVLDNAGFPAPDHVYVTNKLLDT